MPSPDVASMMTVHQGLAEYYSPARVVPVAKSLGITAMLSLDLISGWDFNRMYDRVVSLKILDTLCVMFLILSPPCTVFSELQRLWNFKKLSKEVVAEEWAAGMVHLEHAMACAVKQIKGGRYVVFEHPARASSWNTDVVKGGLQMVDKIIKVTF